MSTQATTEEEHHQQRPAWSLPFTTQGGCGVSFSGDIPDPPGCGAVPPALGDPAWAGGWAGWPTESLPTPNTDSVTLNRLL